MKVITGFFVVSIVIIIAVGAVNARLVSGQASSVCVTGGAIPSGNAGLVADCEALLAMKTALRGSGKLNWWTGRSIEKWDGIKVQSDRVAELSLPNRSLDGVLPAGLGSLSALKTLDLSSNSLTGQIPASLNNLTLNRLRLGGNSLTGCVPANLLNVADSDVSILNLPSCGGTTTPATPTATPLPSSASTPTPTPPPSGDRVTAIEGRLTDIERRLTALEADVARLMATPTPTPTPTPTSKCTTTSLPTDTSDLAPRMRATGGTEVTLRSISMESEPFCRDGVQLKWQQHSGPAVTLLDSGSRVARFVAPAVEEDTTLVFSLSTKHQGQDGFLVSDVVPILINPLATERVLVALIDFLDVEPDQRVFTKEQILDLFVRNPDSLKSFMSHTSRNLLDVNFDVLDWITINKNRTDYPLDGGAVRSDAVSAMSNFADLSQYDKVVALIFPLKYGTPGCTAYLEPATFYTPNGVFELGFATLSGYNMECIRKGRMAHEFGHTFGFAHSYGIHCDKNPPTPGNLLDPTDKNDSCNHAKGTRDAPIVYNDFDMLGGDNVRRYEDYFPVHFHATWQAKAGWLTESQVTTVQKSGDYWLTILESLTPNPKAIKIPLGDDHLGHPQYYWLETREHLDSCQVNVRIQASQIASDSRGRTYWRTYRPESYDTYNYVKANIGVPQSKKGSAIDPVTPFLDPHRGIRIEMMDCTGEGTSAEVVRLKINFTGLQVDTPIFANFEAGEASTSLTNRSGAFIDMGFVSIGGRNPDAFVIHSDECSNRRLDPGASCSIVVRHTSAVSAINNHGLLKIPNSDPLASEMTVSLFQDGDPTSVPDTCIQDIVPGSISGKWGIDCPSATWRAGHYNSRFYTFTLDEEAKISVSVSVDHYTVPRFFLYDSEDVGGTTLGIGSYSADFPNLQPGTYTLEVMSSFWADTGEFTLTFDVDQ